jgi:drug/metabolite transporter (DMT)-like permease
VIALVARKPGGLRFAMASRQWFLQSFRAVLLVPEIMVSVVAYVLLGLVETHAVFASFPLIIAALSGPVLGERVGWRRWAAIGVGMIGILIILRPGFGVFFSVALIPLLAAAMFAI